MIPERSGIYVDFWHGFDFCGGIRCVSGLGLASFNGANSHAILQCKFCAQLNDMSLIFCTEFSTLWFAKSASEKSAQIP